MGHVFHLAWYMNGVGFGDSSRTSVPKIMASDPPVQTLQTHEGSVPACAKTNSYWVADVHVKSVLVDLKGKYISNIRTSKI